MGRSKYDLELDGITCGSCETRIKRIAAQRNAEISTIDTMSGKVTLLCNPEEVDGVKAELAQSGFPEKNKRTGRGNPKRAFAYIKDILTGKKHVEVEAKILTYFIGSATIILTLGFIANTILPNILQLPITLLPLILLLVLGVLMILSSYYHMRCYRHNLSCNNGMMIGMTVGMVSGFLAGAIIGATNGMFIGSVVGMGFGITHGLILGRYCGVMGAMEGIMAGVMAGTMGAMLSVMMITDNIMPFLYILFGVCSIVIGALSYMMHREVGPTPMQHFNTSFGEFVMNSIIVTSLFLVIIIYAPKAGLVLP